MISKKFHLQITTATREQWKLLLEQHKIGYIFPDEFRRNPNECQDQSSEQSADNFGGCKSKIAEQDWQFVIPVTDTNKLTDDSEADEGEANHDEFGQIANYQDDSNELQAQSSTSGNSAQGGIFPAARARLASLRDLGARKIGALKLKLIENKIKSNERGECLDDD